MLRKTVILLICLKFVSCVENPQGYIGLEIIESSVKYELEILSPVNDETVEGYSIIVGRVTGGTGQLTYRSYIDGHINNSSEILLSYFDNIFYLKLNVDSMYSTPTAFMLKVEVEDEDNRKLSKEINLKTRKRNFSSISHTITGFGQNNFNTGDFDSENTFWYSFQPYLVKIQNNQLTEIDDPTFIKNYFSLTTDDSLQVWILGENDNFETILAKYNGTQWTTYFVADDHISSKRLEIDKDGTFWFYNPYPSYEVYSYRNGNTVLYDETSIPINEAEHFDGLRSMAIDMDNNKWFGTSNALFKFNNSSWEKYDVNVVEYYSQVTIDEIYPDKFGGLWLGTNWGFLYFKEGKLQFRVPHFVSYFRATGLAEDISGKLWAASSEEGIVIVNLQTGSVCHYTLEQIEFYLGQVNIGDFVSLDIDKLGNVLVVAAKNLGLEYQFIKIE